MTTAQKPALHPLLRDLFGSVALCVLAARAGGGGTVPPPSSVALCVLAAHLLAGGAA